MPTLPVSNSRSGGRKMDITERIRNIHSENYNIVPTTNVLQRYNFFKKTISVYVSNSTFGKLHIIFVRFTSLCLLKLTEMQMKLRERGLAIYNWGKVVLVQKIRKDLQEH